MKRTVLASIVALALGMSPGKAETIDERVKDVTPPITVWGEAKHLDSSAVALGDSFSVYNNDFEFLQGFKVGYNPDGTSNGLDGWYNIEVNGSLDGVSIHFKHHSAEGDKPVIFINDNSYSLTLDRDDQGKKDIQVQDNASAVPENPFDNNFKFYPNPMNSRGTISFNMPLEGRLNIDIYDIRGRKVKDLVKLERFSQGDNEIVWDGRTNNGSFAPSEVYLAKISGAYEGIVRFTVIK